MSRELRHWGTLPEVIGRRFPGSPPLCLDLPGAGTEHRRPVPRTVSGMTDDLRERYLKSEPRPRGILAVSLGGMIALDWCSRYPDDFERAVVINTSAGDLGRFYERLDWRNYLRIMRIMFTRSELVRERIIIDMTMNRDDFDRAALAEAWAGYGREKPIAKQAVVRQLLAAMRSRLPEQIETKVLVLASKGDKLVRYACSERIAAKLRAPLSLHPSGGHDLPFDDAEWVCDEIEAWISRDDQARSVPAR